MPEKRLTDESVEAAARAALSKKAEDLLVLDLRGLSDVTDYFVICHGQSSRQVQTISDTIQRNLRSLKRRPKHVEGYNRGEWILMDYLDFIVHIFIDERRAYYGLDRLWADAPRMALQEEHPGRDDARKPGTGAGSPASVDGSDAA